MGILVPLSPFITIIAVVFLYLFFRTRRHRAYYGTIQKMIDNKIEIPNELYASIKNQDQRSPKRRGIMWTCLGIGYVLAVFLSEGVSGYWPLGILPICMGIGYLILWKYSDK